MDKRPGPEDAGGFQNGDITSETVVEPDKVVKGNIKYMDVMKNAAERIQVISDYLTGYEGKIAFLNKVGLLDAATLFELFAAEVCRLWFGQDFHNLNMGKANFPAVDLVSEDGQIYVQVSTVQDVSSKIKRTLQKIQNSCDESISRVEKLYFFVLGNKSCKNVKDCSVKTRNGSIEFVASENLITTQTVLEKATKDLGFQKSLYELLISETNVFLHVSESLKNKAALSLELIDYNIDDLINGEYSIDISEQLEELNACRERFISVQGDAGTGKSVLCKRFLRGKELVLYARAERLAEVRSLTDIWELDLRNCMRYLGDTQIYFFLDALEFIADCGKTKQDLLFELYHVVNDYENAQILTTCRSSDKGAFIKLESRFKIHIISTDLLTEGKIRKVADRYPVIRSLRKNKSYSPLLSTPFYLNMIVSHVRSLDTISDVSTIRRFIWQEVICLHDRAKEYQTNENEVKDAVFAIARKRAETFTVAVDRSLIPYRVLNALLAEGIVTETTAGIRLKHDIFEDICFEYWIDRCFEECKADYPEFFSVISRVGKCIFRRFQIWVENKLFERTDREKFLHNILFSSSIPENWREQTLIGVVKSNYCADFMEEYKREIFDYYLERFGKVVNLFAFRPMAVSTPKDRALTALFPIGQGRRSLIVIAEKEGKYKDPSCRKLFAKMCTDYARESDFDETTAQAACTILEFYAEQKFRNLIEGKEYRWDTSALYSYLGSLYSLAEYSGEWVKRFWMENICGCLQGKQYRKKRIARDILKYTLKNTRLQLAYVLPDALCKLAEEYWIREPEGDESSHIHRYESRFLNDAENIGLSGRAQNYLYDFHSADANIFFVQLARANYIKALEWAVKITNHVAKAIQAGNQIPVKEMKIRDEKGNMHTYLGNVDFWVVDINEHAVHPLLSDILYILLREIKTILFSELFTPAEKVRVAERIKKTVYESSNNIMMLTLIERIGMDYLEELPGFAIELASCMDILFYSYKKQATIQPNYAQKLLERRILQIVSMPSLPRRYNMEHEVYLPLADYIRWCQLYCGEDTKTKAEKQLDYLIDITPEDKEHANELFQIQKMDLRGAEDRTINNTVSLKVPRLSETSKSYLSQTKKAIPRDGLNEMKAIMEQILLKKEEGTADAGDWMAAVREVKALRKTLDISYLAENTLNGFIYGALESADLQTAERSECCRIMIEGIESLFDNSNYMIEPKMTSFLFKQIEQELEPDVREALRELMLRCLMYRGNNGIISEIAETMKSYLLSDQKTARELFQALTTQYGNDPGIKEACFIANCGLLLDDESFRIFIHRVFERVIEAWEKDRKIRRGEIDTVAINELQRFIRRHLMLSFEYENVIRLLFDRNDFYKFGEEAFRFYEDSLSILLPIYFDGERAKVSRGYCEQVIRCMEQYIRKIEDAYVYNRMTSYLLLSLGRHFTDWKDLETEYSYRDKSFLNDLWSKYGKSHPVNMLQVIDQMHVNDLLPEVLLSVDICFSELKDNKREFFAEFANRSEESAWIVNEIISEALYNHSDAIRKTKELSNAYESILESLVSVENEVAAVLLDEFRIH